MSKNAYVKTDQYLDNLFAKNDSATNDALENNRSQGLPAIDVSKTQGRFLGILAQIAGAKRVLEIGTLGGYSTIHFARSIPDDGKVVTLEKIEKHANIAKANIANAGLSSKVEIKLGTALDTLATLKGPFDLVFIDADKANMPNYLEWAIKLSKPGTVIVGDNIVRSGEVADESIVDDANVVGARKFLELVAENPKLNATALQTVGSKGHDGFCVARVI